MKNFKDLVKESGPVNEGQKWTFTERNQGMSGTTTISTEVTSGEFVGEFTIGYSNGDGYFGSFYANDEDWDAEVYANDMWQVLGDENSLDTNGVFPLKDILKSVEKDFGVKVDQKSVEELALYVALNF